MRFGQLPSVREMTPDITPLLKARQMKDQAFQNFAGTVMQFAADKKQKDLEKKEEKRSIAAITPFLEDLANRNPELRDIDPKKFIKVHGKNALPELGKYMQASSLQTQAQARFLEQVNEQNKQIVDQNTNAVTQKLEERFGGRGAAVSAEELRAAVPVIASEFGFTQFNPNVAASNAFTNIMEAAKMQGESEDAIASVQKGLSNTVNQFMTQESIVNTAKDVYVDLKEIIGDNERSKKELDLIRQTARGVSTTELKQRLSQLTGTSDEVIAQGYAYFASLLKGTGASAFQQKLSALAGRIANTVLQGTRESSADGSSGYGQLTGPELTLLKNFYGSLLTESGSLADFDVIRGSLERIMTELPEAAARRFDNASKEYGIKKSLGYSQERARNEMLEQLRQTPSFELFDLKTFKPFDVQSFINQDFTSNRDSGDTPASSDSFGGQSSAPYKATRGGTFNFLSPVTDFSQAPMQNEGASMQSSVRTVNGFDITETSQGLTIRASDL